jgi:peptide/nickel transport system substrate-binding protein
MFKKLCVLLIICLLLSTAVFAGGKKEPEKGAERVSEADDEKKYAGTLEMDQVIEYKALSKYGESPKLAKLVKAGKLPPVKERLPSKPAVLKKNIMHHGIGEYGGIWRDTFAGAMEGWNWAAGRRQGAYGIHQMTHEPLVRTGPMWYLKNPEPVPNLATDWNWSSDGKILTMNLVEGAKWSDGHLFTSEDVRFTYEDNILDKNVPSRKGVGAWTFGGKLTKLEVVNDYQIKWHFGVAYPLSVLWDNMRLLNFTVSPAHVYKNLHPKHNSKATYEAYIRATPPQDLPIVGMNAWVPVKYEPDQLLVMVRNPYYWKVDEEGNQLPYLDEIWFADAEKGAERLMNFIAGTGDRTYVEDAANFVTLRKKSLEPGSNMKISYPLFIQGQEVLFNLSKDLGVKNEKDLAIRELFRNLEFRKALAYATDKWALAKAVFDGPLVQPYPGGLNSGSVYWAKEHVVEYEYDLNRAKQILSKLGFKDTDGNGMLNWPSNSAFKGADLILELLNDVHEPENIRTAESWSAMMRQVGIDVRIRGVQPKMWNARTDSGDFQLTLWGKANTDPFIQMSDLFPVSPEAPLWHMSGEGKRALLPFEQEMQPYLEELKSTLDPKVRRKNIEKLLKLYTENVYTLGIYESRFALAYDKRFRNIAPDTPSKLYFWFPSNIPIPIVWVPKAEQLGKEQFEDLIPTKEDYSNRSWQK